MDKQDLIRNAIGRFRLKKLVTCYGCGKSCRKEIMTPLTQDDPQSMICPTCGFVMAMYIQSGLRTTFTEGSLDLHFINSQFRKAAQEFINDPKAAEEKYLSAFRKRLEDETRIKLTDKKIRLFDQFPFIFMTPEEFNRHKPERGKEFTLYGKTLEIKRRVYYVQEMREEDCVKYGRTGVNYVCYMPENFEE